MKFLQPKQVFNRIGWFFCVYEAIMFFVQVVLIVGLFLFQIDPTKNMNAVYILNALSLYATAFPLFALCMTTLEGKAKKEKKRLGIRNFIIIFIICFSLSNLTNLINVLFSSWFHLVTGRELVSNTEEILSEVSFLMVLTTVVLAPVFEELTFRYLVINKLRRYGDKTAIIVSAILFGLFHMNFEQGIYAAVIGLVLGYVVCRTGRVIYTIMLHACFNLLSGVIPLVIENLKNPVLNSVYMVLYFALILIGFILFISRRKQIKLECGEERLTHPVESFLGNPGMLIFTLLCVITMVITLYGQIWDAFQIN